MTETRRSGRGRPRDPEADTAILRAALELFVERGVDGTSFEQIAKRAGVARLTLYRRWSSKEELLARAIESTLDEAPKPSVEEAARLPLVELVERALPAAVGIMADPGFPAMIAQIMGSTVRYPTLMATYWEHYILPRRRIVHLMLERAKQEGTVAEDADIDVLIDMMVGAIMWRVLQPKPFDAAEARRYLEAVYRQTGLLPAQRPGSVEA
ncbi:MAG: TetR family transcriptional regulator [Streptosporangiales bacterium]|nr:TetR family transcriptional regulator [Streptosporangiales bacterium]